jgi:hypothetical protein
LIGSTVAPEELLPMMAAAVHGLSRSQVGRLQLVAARMWLLEQRGEPIERWWPVLRDYLEGMRHANLEHDQTALTRHWAAAYQAVGLGPGTAYELAENLVGHAHGPFLEFFVPRLRRVVAERDQAGDTAAATTCRSVLYRMLRQWVLEPNSAGLRLLAADLLAESLESDAGLEPPTQAQAIARSLRRWRSDYHEAARNCPVAILDPQRPLALAPAEHERLLARVGLMTWLASGTLTAGILALVFGWSWLRCRGGVARRIRLVLSAIGLALIVAIGGVLWIHLWPDAIRADLRRDFSSWRYWWRHPFLAAGLTLALVLAGALLQRAAFTGRARWAARLGAVAAGTWLVLAAMLWGSAWAGELARRDYERALRAAYEDPVAALVGPGADRALTELRRWNP